MAVTLSNSQLSAGLYSAFWNRAPDYTGQQFWVGQLNDGADLVDVATFFYNSDEGKAAYPNWMRSGTPTANAELVTAVYEQVFERAPDAEGLAFWTAQLNSGQFTFPEVVIGMMNSAIESAAEGNTDGMQFLNEIQVGIYVAETLRTDDPAITSIALQGVTYEESSVYIREAQLDEMVDPANTYTLTTNIDIASAQYFDGSLNTFGQQTLQSFDELTGQKTYNVLDAEIVQNVTPAILDNIQQIEITHAYVGGGAKTIGLLNANAVEVIVNDGSLGGLTFSNVGDTLQAVGVQNLLTAQDTTVTFSSVANVAELDLVFENVAGGTVTIADVETVNVFSEIEDSTTGLALADATTLTFAGDANLTATLGAVTNGVSLFDASAMDGDLTLTIGAQSQVLSTTDISVLGGNGDDTFTVSAVTQDYTIALGAGNDTVVDTAIGDNDSIEGGEGVDTLSTTYAQAAALTTANGVNGIDVLELTTALNGTLTTATVDSTIDTLSVSVAGPLTAAASTVTGSAGEFTVNLGASGAGNTGALAHALTLTDTGTGTTDTLNINNVAVNSTNNTNVNVFAAGNVTSTGYENVTISTGDASPTAQTIGTLTITVDNTAGLPSAAASLTVDGSSSLAVTSLVTNSTGLLTVDASDLNVLTTANGLTISGTTQGVGGTASITGSAGADTVVTGNFASTVYGGTGNDALTGGTAADQLHGEAGNDTLTGSGGNDTIRGGEGNDTISSIVAGVVDIDGGSGNDTVSLAATLGATDVVNGGEGVDTLSVTAAITGTTGVGVTNFEVLLTTVDQAMTNTVNNNGWTTVYADATNVAITNALAAVTTYEVDATASGTHSFARLVDTGTDALTFVALANNAMTSFTASDEETITLNTADGSVAFTGLTAADLTTLTATGDNNAAATLVGSTGLTTLTNSLTGTATFNVNAGVSTSAVTFTANGGSTGTSTVTSGSGADVITAALAAALDATSGAGNDTITGGNLADTLSGGSGADVLIATAGADTLTGGAGSDTITGGTDLLATFSAGDLAAIGADGGTDTIAGFVVNLGSTTLTAAAIQSASGLYTADGNTSVAANSTAYLKATNGTGLSTSSDTLSNIRNVEGSTGTDYIVGSASADNLNGGAAVDTISGGSGNDVITGGTGADSLTGGAGVDQFAAYTTANSTATVAADTTVTSDTITDFTTTVDTIQLDSAGAVDFTALATATVTAATYNNVATFAALKTAMDTAGIVASTTTSAQVYDVTLTGTGLAAAGVTHLLFVNNGDTALTVADVMINLTGTSSASVVAGDFTFI